MHPSYFVVLKLPESDDSRNLSLSADVSEWLFFKEFWQEINRKHKVSFGQYEDDVLQANHLNHIIQKLEDINLETQSQNGSETKFIYGWSENGNELVCSIDYSKIIREVSSLTELFEKSKSINSDVYCQL